VSDRASPIVVRKGPVPVQEPHHPVKTEAPSGGAVNVTGVPLGKLAGQVVPQSMPGEFDVTVPERAPCLLTVMANVVGRE
jgi:hypothetical protein